MDSLAITIFNSITEDVECIITRGKPPATKADDAFDICQFEKVIE